jgi:3-methyladenine DNA glycosylase/8-oxoguanine DNA glycosylase
VRAAEQPDGPADRAVSQPEQHGRGSAAVLATAVPRRRRIGDSGPAEQAADGQRRDWVAPYPLDLRLILGVHRRGAADPAFRTDERGRIWRTTRTPDGPATLRLAAAPEPAGGLRVSAAAWGAGASWVLEQLPDLVGAADDPAAFRPVHPRLAELARRHPGLRLGRTDRLMEALVPAVLEQKVVGVEARRAWRCLLTWYGDPAPGPAPAGMRVFPAARTWAAIPAWDWHRAGVEAVRAATIAGAAERADRLEELAGCSGGEADRRLQSLPGIGPWTSAEVRQRAWGDPDAVSVGDYHLPGQVGWTLTGRPADDEGMLALLAPYAGQRHRAARLIEVGGGGPPRRGPRMSARDYRMF